MTGRWSVFCAAVLAVLMASCSSTTVPEMPADMSERTMDIYRIGASDVLSVKLFYTPELNDKVAVRPDGRVSLHLIGDVAVAGLTPEEASREISERYKEHLAKSNVVVSVAGFGSQRAFIGGEVRHPVMVQLDGQTTLVDAIFSAGGSLDTAELTSVILVRREEAGRKAYRVDLEGVLRGQNPLPVLQAYDVVFVPKSFIAKVGTYVDLYINRIIPRNTGFTAIYEIDKTNLGSVGAVVPN